MEKTIEHFLKSYPNFNNYLNKEIKTTNLQLEKKVPKKIEDQIHKVTLKAIQNTPHNNKLDETFSESFSKLKPTDKGQIIAFFVCATNREVKKAPNLLSNKLSIGIDDLINKNPDYITVLNYLQITKFDNKKVSENLCKALLSIVLSCLNANGKIDLENNKEVIAEIIKEFIVEQEIQDLRI